MLTAAPVSTRNIRPELHSLMNNKLFCLSVAEATTDGRLACFQRICTDGGGMHVLAALPIFR